MKQVFIATVLIFLIGTLNAQDSTKEVTAINAQVDAFFTSWNKHDFSDMKNYIAENCDFINTAGMHWKGRKDIEYAHNKVHEDIFKDKPLTKVSASIRFLTNDVAVTHVHMHLEGNLVTPDGSKRYAPDALATFVFLKQNGVWLITAAENVFIDKEAAPFDPIKQMPKN